MLHLEHQSGISRNQGDRKHIPVSLILSDVFICVYLQGPGDMERRSSRLYFGVQVHFRSGFGFQSSKHLGQGGQGYFDIVQRLV